MSNGFPIGNQIKKDIQKALFERIFALNRTDSEKNPLSSISDEIESNPYSQMLTKSCWVRVSGTSPTFKKEGGKFVRPLQIESEEAFQLRGDFKDGELVNQPITSKTNLLDNSPASNLRAPAGITGISTSFKSHSIQNITINWKMYDPDDFEVYEKMFLKHGRSVLVEFGWSVPGIEFNTLKNVNDMFSYYTALEERILKGGGNYNAAIGLIKSFSWNVGPNGEYDCTTELTSMGNTLFKGTVDPAGNVGEVVSKKNEEALEKALQNIGQHFDGHLENFEQRIKDELDNNPKYKNQCFYNEKDETAYCTWGYFEDRVLNKYFAVASNPNANTETYKGLLTFVRSTDISYEPDGGDGFKTFEGPTVCRFPKKTNRNESALFTLSKDIILPNLYIGEPAIINAPTSFSGDVKKEYQAFIETINGIKDNFQEFQQGEFGVIRNFVFSTEFLRNSFKGIRNLESGLQTFWATVSGQYGGYWNFEVYQSPTNNGKLSVIDTNITKFRVKDINPFKKGKSFQSTYEDVNGNVDSNKLFVFPVYSNRSLFKDFSVQVNISSAMATQAMFHSNTDYKTSGLGGNPSPENKGVVALAELYNATVTGEPEENDKLQDGLFTGIYFPYLENLQVEIKTDEDGNVTYETNLSTVKSQNIINTQNDIEKENAANDEDVNAIRWLSVNELENPNTAELVYSSKGELKPSFVRGMQWFLNKGPDSKTDFDPLTPLEVSFTMPGIAGIKLYDLFAVDYLPKLYRDFGLFMVTSMDHTVSPQGWETKITGKMRIDMEGLEQYAEQTNNKAPTVSHNVIRGTNTNEQSNPTQTISKGNKDGTLNDGSNSSDGSSTSTNTPTNTSPTITGTTTTIRTNTTTFIPPVDNLPDATPTNNAESGDSF